MQGIKKAIVDDSPSFTIFRVFLIKF